MSIEILKNAPWRSFTVKSKKDLRRGIRRSIKKKTYKRKKLLVLGF